MRHPFSSRSRVTAFTLIELLVVVAIISILAAIALPNFLEAMVRTRVASTKNDLRTIGLGLEMNRIDRGWYPPDAQFGVINFSLRLRYLTTPTAYLSRLPGDPFANEGEIEAYAREVGVNPYAWPPVPGGNFDDVLTYDYAWRRLPGGGLEDDLTWGLISRNPSTTEWALRGIGPDQRPDFLGTRVPPYDPTNGSVSRGVIFWTGPGKGEDQPRRL